MDSKDSDNFQLLLYFINLAQQLNLNLLEDKFYQHFYWCYLTKKQHFLYKFILLNLKCKSELATELTLKTLAMGSLQEEKYSLQYKDLIQTVFSYLSKNNSKQLIEMGNKMKDNYQLYQKSLNMLGKEVQTLYKGMLIYELKKKLELSVFSRFIQKIDIYQWPNVTDSCINRSLLIYFKLLKENNNENENTNNDNKLTIETITSFYNDIKQYRFINVINTLLYGLILNDEFLLAHQFLINFNIQLNQQLLQTMLYGNKLNFQYLQIFNYYQQQIKIQNIQLNNPILSLLLQNLIYHQQYEMAYNYLLQYNSEADIKLKSIISKLFIYLNYQQIQILKNKFNLFDLQNEYQLSSLLSLAINKKQYNLLNYLIKEHLINNDIKIDSNLANKLKIIQLKFPSLKNQLHLLKQ
ncbi:hypothetical protein K502DRAFT_325047 [Neoconidiobolus thromboides FSU 785]|nr:hypothetical protein K502DRAFT_325047 [Neoconidiobolus thromboides FSU 785]